MCIPLRPKSIQQDHAKEKKHPGMDETMPVIHSIPSDIGRRRIARHTCQSRLIPHHLSAIRLKQNPRFTTHSWRLYILYAILFCPVAVCPVKKRFPKDTIFAIRRMPAVRLFH